MALVFLPTILKDMGFSSINAQGLTAPPFFLSFLVTIFSTYIADKYQQRGITIFILSVIGGVGYVLLASCELVGVRYFGVFLAAAGVTTRSPKKNPHRNRKKELIAQSDIPLCCQHFAVGDQ